MALGMALLGVIAIIFGASNTGPEVVCVMAPCPEAEGPDGEVFITLGVVLVLIAVAVAVNDRVR